MVLFTLLLLLFKGLQCIEVPAGVCDATETPLVECPSVTWATTIPPTTSQDCMSVVYRTNEVTPEIYGVSAWFFSFGLIGFSPNSNVRRSIDYCESMTSEFYLTISLGFNRVPTADDYDLQVDNVGFLTYDGIPEPSESPEIDVLQLFFKYTDEANFELEVYCDDLGNCDAFAGEESVTLYLRIDYHRPFGALYDGCAAQVTIINCYDAAGGGTTDMLLLFAIIGGGCFGVLVVCCGLAFIVGFIVVKLRKKAGPGQVVNKRNSMMPNQMRPPMAMPMHMPPPMMVPPPGAGAGAKQPTSPLPGQPKGQIIPPAGKLPLPPPGTGVAPPGKMMPGGMMQMPMGMPPMGMQQVVIGPGGRPMIMQPRGPPMMMPPGGMPPMMMPPGGQMLIKKPTTTTAAVVPPPAAPAAAAAGGPKKTGGAQPKLM